MHHYTPKHRKHPIFTRQTSNPLVFPDDRFSSDHPSTLYASSTSAPPGPEKTFSTESLSSIKSSSTNSASLSMLSSAHNQLSQDIQILFHDRGATIVKEGERVAGIYFVIDGVLEASMSKTGEEIASSISNDFSYSSSLSTDDGASRKPTHEPSHPARNSKDRLSQLEEETEYSEAGSITSGFGSKRKSLFLIKPGGLAGYLAALTGAFSCSPLHYLHYPLLP